MIIAVYPAAVLVMLSMGKAQALAPQDKLATERAQVLYCWVQATDRSSAQVQEELLRTSLMMLDEVAEVQFQYDKPTLLRAAISLDDSFPVDGAKLALMDSIRSVVEVAGMKVVHIGDTPKLSRPWYKRSWAWGVALAIAGARVAMLTGKQGGEPDAGGDHPGMEH